MKFILRLLLLLLLALPAWCATSTLTGTFVDASGNPVNGYLILSLPVPAVDTATGNSIAVTPVRYRVVNGIVQSGPPVYDVAGLQPQNLYYITSLYDNSGTRIFTANYYITGTPFNLSAAIPTNVTTSNISFAAGNIVNLAGNNAFTGNNTHSGTETFTGVINCTIVNIVRCISPSNPQGWAGITPDQWLQSAINSLPSCNLQNNYNVFTATYQTITFNHCGEVDIAEGAYNFAATVSISSPYVLIRGAGGGATTLACSHTSGACLYWTMNPFISVNDQPGMGGLYNLTIDGFSASAGTYGLQTDQMNNFHSSGVVVQNFSGAGSIGWYDTASTTTVSWNEKYNVQIGFMNDATAWYVFHGSAVGGASMGYGVFDISCLAVSGQTCVVLDGGTNASILLNYSNIHMTMNLVSNPANASGLVLKNSAALNANLSLIHMEAPNGMGTGNQINICSTCSFANFGVLDQDSPSSNVVASGGVFNQFIVPTLTNTPFPFTQNSSTTTGDSSGVVSTLNQNVAKTGGFVYGINSNAIYQGAGAYTGSDIFGISGFAAQKSTGTVPTLRGVGGQVSALNSGVVTTGTALYAWSPNISGGGAITNAYGLYLNTQKVAGVTNGFGIRQVGANDLNQFDGPLGVGGGTNLARYARYTPSLSPSSVAANTTAEQCFTSVLTSGDFVIGVSKPTVQAGLGIVGWRASGTSACITFSNNTASPITPTASETYQIVGVQ